MPTGSILNGCLYGKQFRTTWQNSAKALPLTWQKSAAGDAHNLSPASHLAKERSWRCTQSEMAMSVMQSNHSNPITEHRRCRLNMAHMLQQIRSSASVDAHNLTISVMPSIQSQSIAAALTWRTCCSKYGRPQALMHTI